MKEIIVKDKVISQNTFTMIAGPCSIESEEQMREIMENVEADFYRGGVYKPRTTADSFQGLREEGLALFKKLRNEYNKLIITEIMSIDQLKDVGDIDIIQIGARNMQNYDLLIAAGKTNKPILIKRGLANTVDEMLGAISYIEAQGNNQIILCERGFRSFDNITRFTLDVAAIPVLKARTPYPVIVDPSHAAGVQELVEPLALAAVAAGCDGLLIEVHPNPECALSDADQQLTINQYKNLKVKVEKCVQLR